MQCPMSKHVVTEGRKIPFQQENPPDRTLGRASHPLCIIKAKSTFISDMWFHSSIRLWGVKKEANTAPKKLESFSSGHLRLARKVS